MNRVTLSRTAGRAVLVRTNFSDFGRRLNAVEYFFDTNRRNVGPEYGALIYRGKDGDGIKRVEVYRMKSFKERGAHDVTCRWRYKWYYNGRGPGYFNAKFPLGCFEGNGKRFVARARQDLELHPLPRRGAAPSWVSSATTTTWVCRRPGRAPSEPAPQHRSSRVPTPGGARDDLRDDLPTTSATWLVSRRHNGSGRCARAVVPIGCRSPRRRARRAPPRSDRSEKEVPEP